MLKLIQKYFIPHEKNDFQPHFLRAKTIKFLAGLMVVLELVFLFQVYVILPKFSHLLALILPDVIVSETNENRLANDLPTLQVNQLLQEAAREKANDMAQDGYFAHTSPDGKTPWYWFDRVGYVFVYAGENLALNFADSQQVVDAWMNSTGHRANILNKYFTEIGVGVATGEYQGADAIFVAQLFGKQASKTVSALTQTNTSSNSLENANLIASPLPSASLNPTDSGVDNFVAVKSADNGELSNLELETDVDTENNVQPLVLEKFLANPKVVALYLYCLIGGLILVALLLSIFVKFERQSPKLIFNGFMLLFFVGGLIVVNQFVVTGAIQII